MGERAHTPGPWRISKLTETAVEDGDGRGICSTGGYQQNFDTERVYQENRANARLIAAAPDLLDACKRASEILRGRGYPGWGVAKDILNEAIAKAEGLGQRADATSSLPAAPSSPDRRA